jgi:hypothetical protein
MGRYLPRFSSKEAKALLGAAQGMSEIRNWLEANGLGQYGNAFEADDIDMDLLKQVDDQMLKDIGVDERWPPVAYPKRDRQISHGAGR